MDCINNQVKVLITFLKNAFPILICLFILGGLGVLILIDILKRIF